MAPLPCSTASSISARSPRSRLRSAIGLLRVRAKPADERINGRVAGDGHVVQSFEYLQMVLRNPRAAWRSRSVHRARDGDQGVSKQASQPRVRKRSGDEKVRHLRQEWERMTGVAQALAEVLDPRAAQIADLGDEPRVRVRYRAQHTRDEASDALERSTEVRGPEIDGASHERQPSLPLEPGGVACAARDEPSHAVADEDDLVRRRRIPLDEEFEHPREARAALRDREARVVADV